MKPISSMNPARVQEIINKNYPGLQIYARDLDLDPNLAAIYKS